MVVHGSDIYQRPLIICLLGPVATTADCKSALSEFGGSSPSVGTILYRFDGEEA